MKKEILSNKNTEEYFTTRLSELTDKDILKEIDERIKKYHGDKQEKEFSLLIINILKLTNKINGLIDYMPYFQLNKNSLVIGSLNDIDKIDLVASILSIDDNEVIKEITEILLKQKDTNLLNCYRSLNTLETKEKAIYDDFNNFILNKNEDNETKNDEQTYKFFKKIDLNENSKIVKQIKKYSEMIVNYEEKLPRHRETGKIGEKKVYNYLTDMFKNKGIDINNDIKWLNGEEESGEHYDILVKLPNGKELYFEVKSSEFGYENEGRRISFGLSYCQMKKAEEVCNENNGNKYYVVRVYNARDDNPKIFFFEVKKDIIIDN